MAGSTPHQMKVGFRPLIIGLVHGLAGSAALMFMVLSTVASPVVGLAYILIFGLGSIGGMIVMSSLFSLPFHFTANRFTRANFAVRLLAGCSASDSASFWHTTRHSSKASGVEALLAPPQEPPQRLDRLP